MLNHAPSQLIGPFGPPNQSAVQDNDSDSVNDSLDFAPVVSKAALATASMQPQPPGVQSTWHRSPRRPAAPVAAVAI